MKSASCGEKKREAVRTSGIEDDTECSKVDDVAAIEDAGVEVLAGNTCVELGGSEGEEGRRGSEGAEHEGAEREFLERARRRGGVEGKKVKGRK